MLKLLVTQVFGVPPPQTLYTRPLASHSLCSTAAAYSGTIPAAQTGPPSPVGKNRNPNQAPYKGKKKHDRPGTSESTQRLLPSCISGSFDFDPQSPSSLVIPDVYTHYQHSLLSLNDIIDRVIVPILTRRSTLILLVFLGRSRISRRTPSISTGRSH